MSLLSDSKDTIDARISQAIAPLLEPTERVVASGLALEGPSPIFTAFGGSELDYRQYFVALTESRLILVKSSQWSNKAKRGAYAGLRSAVRLKKWKQAWGWTSLWIDWGTHVSRLNFNRLWKQEAITIQSELRSDL